MVRIILVESEEFFVQTTFGILSTCPKNSGAHIRIVIVEIFLSFFIRRPSLSSLRNLIKMKSFRTFIGNYLCLVYDTKPYSMLIGLVKGI